ncbi:MAG: phosphotransferase [Methylacidiphilales bacterium]|nr:phosphotransferase [Candidatus Methylacidiphilales bacterium]
MKDRLDIEQTDDLIDYLRSRGLFKKEENCSAVVLRGGVSNKTVLVKGQTRSMVVKQALEKLRVSTDWHADPARIEREAIGLRLLERLAPAGAITPLVFEDASLFLLGMEAVPDPHENWKTVLLRSEIADDAIHQFGALLGRIHFQGTKLNREALRLIRDRRFFKELRIDPYYRFTAGNNPDVAEFYARLISDMKGASLTVVHGDFSPKNILVHQGRLVLLDHEVIHLGDPTFDLGFALTHLISKANHLRSSRKLFLQAAGSFWKSYVGEAGSLAAEKNFESRACRQALACLLARIDGRSPLEYLTPEERVAQKQAALELMQKPPVHINDLIHEFGSRL